MINYELLERLCRANSVSGDEDSVRSIIIDEIKPYADSISVDPLGSVLVHKRGKNRAKAKLMLSAHMDEVGLMVTDITSDGYLKFDEVGGIDRRAQQVLQHDGDGQLRDPAVQPRGIALDLAHDLHLSQVI